MYAAVTFDIILILSCLFEFYRLKPNASDVVYVRCWMTCTHNMGWMRVRSK